jgi:hypothetical protein
MFCADCGSTVPEGGRFCTACGRPVVSPEGTAAGAAGAALAAAAPPPLSGASPIPPPLPSSFGPPALPRKPPSRHPGLVPGIVTAVIILAVGIGVGLFFGIKDRSTTEAVSTTATLGATTSTTVAPPTTLPPTPTASADVTAVLTQRATDWMTLLESIHATGHDMTAQIAAFLAPKDQAQKRAAEYQAQWSTPSDPADIIDTDTWDKIVKVEVAKEGSHAITTIAHTLGCRDGLTTRGLEALSWLNQNGEWMRAVSYQPPSVAQGSIAPFGGAVAAGALVWSPETLHELKHLSAKGGPTASGMFMAVEFYVRNDGQRAISPGSWQVVAVDGTDKKYSPSKTADKYRTGDVQDRRTKIAIGGYTYLWYTFEIPEGLDFQSVKFMVLLPGI